MCESAEDWLVLMYRTRKKLELGFKFDAVYTAENSEHVTCWMWIADIQSGRTSRPCATLSMRSRTSGPSLGSSLGRS
jgi:hypothetical protein